MALQWDDSYSTGNDQVDKQHKILFDLIDKVEKNIETGVDAGRCANFIDALGLFTRTHFCYEEICMRKAKCSLAEKNKEEHKKLLAAYMGFKERFENEGVSEDLMRKLHATLESWITNHILKVDTSLREADHTKTITGRTS